MPSSFLKVFGKSKIFVTSLDTLILTSYPLFWKEKLMYNKDKPKTVEKSFCIEARSPGSPAVSFDLHKMYEVYLNYPNSYDHRQQPLPILFLFSSTYLLHLGVRSLPMCLLLPPSCGCHLFILNLFVLSASVFPSFLSSECLLDVLFGS